MTMRITPTTLTKTVLSDIQNLEQRLATTQEQLSSGYVINRPSDNPYGSGRDLGLRADLAATKQYTSNVSDATAWSNLTDTALGNINDVIGRARDLVVRAATGTMSQSDLTAIGSEIQQLAESAKEAANVNYDGRYVLSGSSVLTPPYTTATGDVYQGDTSAITRQIGPNSYVTVNQNAGSILGSGSTASDGKLLDVLSQIGTDLSSGNVASLGTTDLRNLDGLQDQVGQMRAETGAIGNRLGLAQDRLDIAQTTATGALSQVEDADMAKTMTDYSTQQTAYEAALKAGASLIQPSLLDFLN